MNKWVIATVGGIVFLMLFSGCTVSSGDCASAPVTQSATVQGTATQNAASTYKTQESAGNKAVRDVINEGNVVTKTFSVVGEGVAPVNTISSAQAIALARRAAIADAYRQLGEKLYGVKISAKETIKDAALKNSKIVTQVNALIKNAVIMDNAYKDGLYMITMELTIDGEVWKELFSYR